MTTRKKKPSATAGNDGFSLISNEKLIALYAAMLRCHMLDVRIRALAGPGRSTFGRGHEAAVAGTVIDLLPEDSISPPRGSLAPCLVKGVRLKTIFKWLHLHPDALPARYAPRKIIAPGADIATQLKAAHRAAQLSRAAKKKNLVVVFADCAQLTRRAGLEFLRAAAAERLPILFVCHARPSKEAFAPKARDYGLPGMLVDGDDVVAVYRVISEAITHARRGNGPTLIECKPWMVAGQKKRGALRNMEAYLTRKGLFSAKLKADLTARFARELDKAAQL